MLQSMSGAPEAIRLWSSHPMHTLMCTKDTSTHFITFGITAPWLFMWWWTTSISRQGERPILFSGVLYSSLIYCLASSATDEAPGIPIAELDLEEMEWSGFFGFNRPLKLRMPIVCYLYVHFVQFTESIPVNNRFFIPGHQVLAFFCLSLCDLVSVR